MATKRQEGMDEAAKRDALRSRGPGALPRRVRNARLEAMGQRPWTQPLTAGSLEELRHAREFVARLVVDQGEWLLPIFDRLDREVAARESAGSAMDRVRALLAGEAGSDPARRPAAHQ